MLSDWLRQALEHSGLSQAELGRRFALEVKRSDDRSVINKMLKGKRDIKAQELLALAKLTGFPPPEALSSQEKSDFGSIAIIGYVGAGAAIVNYDEHEKLVCVPMIEEATRHTKALRIAGAVLGDMFDNWLAYFDDLKEPPSDAIVGRPCVVCLKDGRCLVRKVSLGSISGRHTLTSNFEPPIYDAEVEWASPILSMRPQS